MARKKKINKEEETNLLKEAFGQDFTPEPTEGQRLVDDPYLGLDIAAPEPESEPEPTTEHAHTVLMKEEQRLKEEILEREAAENGRMSPKLNYRNWIPPKEYSASLKGMDTSTKYRSLDEIEEEDMARSERIEAYNKSDPNDPRDEGFMTCTNNTCPYREGCMRYLMHRKRVKNQGSFFPEECRAEGIYMSKDSSDFQGYESLERLERLPSNPLGKLSE